MVYNVWQKLNKFVHHCCMAKWKTLQLTLERAYMGAPTGRAGEFEGIVLTVWQILRGSVWIEKEGELVISRAGDRRWVVCTPGKRRQKFSDDAELISLHFLLESPGDGAEWHGMPVLAVAPRAEDVDSLSRLMKFVEQLGLSESDTLRIGRVDLSLEATLALRSVVYEFVYRLMGLLGSSGLCYEPPQLSDERVAKSYRELSARDPRIELKIDQLASELGITVGQLNRLWQRELGITPRSYWDQRRIRFACNLLQIRRLPVKVVAAELGYRHLSQFSNWFSKRMGCAPKKYGQVKLS